MTRAIELAKDENGNTYTEFSDWLAEKQSGIPNGSVLTEDDYRMARDAWTHGHESGHHVGHVEGYQLRESASQWQPIENCPLETPVLVVWNGVTQFNVLQLRDDGSWFDMNGDHWEDFAPTKFMPLPEAPKP